MEPRSRYGYVLTEMSLFFPFSSPAAAPPIIMSCCLWRFIFRSHRHIQILRFLLTSETHCTVCGLPHLAHPLRRNLHPISARTCLPDPG